MNLKSVSFFFFFFFFFFFIFIFLIFSLLENTFLEQPTYLTEEWSLLKWSLFVVFFFKALCDCFAMSLAFVIRDPRFFQLMTSWQSLGASKFPSFLSFLLVIITEVVQCSECFIYAMVVFVFRDLERRIVEAEMDLTLAKSQGYLKNHLQQSGSSSSSQLLAVIGVYTGFGGRLKRNVFRGSWMPRGQLRFIVSKDADWHLKISNI